MMCWGSCTRRSTSGQIFKAYLPSGDNHIILDIHWYATNTVKSQISPTFKSFARITINRGYGAVFGECGLTTANALNFGEEWANAFILGAKECGIPCFIWDDGGNFKQLHRKFNDWETPEYIAAVVNAALTEVATTTTTTTTKPTTQITTTQATTTLVKTTSATTTDTNNSTTTTKHLGYVATYGDPNVDDKINMADVLLLRKYLAKWSVTINLFNADCNADGKINMADVLVLRKYLAKWNVELG